MSEAFDSSRFNEVRENARQERLKRKKKGYLWGLYVSL